MVDRRCDIRRRLPARCLAGVPTITPAGMLVPSATVTSLGRRRRSITQGRFIVQGRPILRRASSESRCVAVIAGARCRRAWRVPIGRRLIPREPIGSARANRTAILVLFVKKERRAAPWSFHVHSSRRASSPTNRTVRFTRLTLSVPDGSSRPAFLVPTGHLTVAGQKRLVSNTTAPERNTPSEAIGHALRYIEGNYSPRANIDGQIGR
jgi:hypothetical protein